MSSPELQKLLPRRLRKCVAESLRTSLQTVDGYWLADRLRVITPESEEARPIALEALVFPEDRVLLDGRLLGAGAPLAYALLNKPKGVTSTTWDPNGQSNLAPYLRAMPAGCFPVGRLDRETTGLLLCTNDGDLAGAVLRPDHQTTKSYWLWLDEVLTEHDPRLERLLEGVVHNGERLHAHAVRLLACTDYASELELILTQGKKRQIRHMCRALNLRLVHLHRRGIGPLTDRGLNLGNWRLLATEEVEALWQAAGGRANVFQRKLAALRNQAERARREGSPECRLEQWLASHDAAERHAGGLAAVHD